MKIMKLVIATIITAIIIAVLSSSVYAGTVLSVNTTENDGKITVSGTVDSSVYAVAVVVYSGDNLEYMETTNVTDDGTYNVELAKTFADGKYTVKVADYNGGTYETEENVVVGTSEENNPIDNDGDKEDNNATENEEEKTEEDKVVENNENSPQTGDVIRNAFIVLGVAIVAFGVTFIFKKNNNAKKH